MEKIKKLKEILKKNYIEGYIIPKNDEFFGESLVLQNTLVIKAVHNSIDLQNATITIEFQGCAAGKYCYPKQRKNI